MTPRQQPIRYVGALSSRPATDVNEYLGFTSVVSAARYLRENGTRAGDILTIQQLQTPLPADQWPAAQLDDESFGWHSPIQLTLGSRGGVSGGGL